MKKFTIILGAIFVFALVNNPCLGQKKNIFVTWNPFSFLEPVDAGFTPGVEFKIGKQISVLSDVGWIFNNLSDVEANIVFGYKIKPEFRYYFNYNENLKGFFISAEGLYKHVDYHNYSSLSILDNNGNFLYANSNGYNTIKDVLGLSGKLGFRFYFTKAEKLGMDVYIGLGGKEKSFRYKNFPAGGSINNPFRSEFSVWQPGGTINIPAGIKLIWRLK